MEDRTLFWKSKRTRVIASVILLPIVIAFTATRSFVLSPLLTHKLQDEFGQEFEVEKARWVWSGGITAEKIILTSDITKSEASEVVALKFATIHFNSAFPLFDQRIESIEIEEVLIRLAESTEHMGEYNFSHLFSGDSNRAEEDKSEISTKSSQSIPAIDLKKLIVESGRMNEHTWMHESTRHFSVNRFVGERWDLSFQLIDVEDDLNIDIGFSTQDSKLLVNVEDVLINESIIGHMPQSVRIWCEETEFEGNVNDLIFTWSPNEGIQIVAAVEGINFILPEQLSPPWAHYNDGEISRMRGKASLDIQTGQIIFDGSSVAMKNIQGTLSPPDHENEVPVPFGGDIEISGLSSAVDPESSEWMKDLLATAPFRARFVIETVESPKGESGDVELPLVAARVLQIFQLEEWHVHAAVNVERTSSGGTVDVNGVLKIDGNAGMYTGFPYPLKGIQSRITFRQDHIKPANEQDLSSGEASVYMSFEAAGGGIGELTGSVQFYDDGVVIPDIQLTVSNEKITPALAEAISLVSGDAYDTVLGVLNGMGLEAELTLSGSILGDDQGDTKTLFTARIENGVATPNDNLSSAIHTSGPFWPDGFQFTDVDGTITIENGAVMMNGATFTCDTGSLEATLLVQDGEFKLELDCSSLPISPRFIDVLPNNVSGKLTSAWGWLEPGGLMDADILIGRKSGVSSLHMEMVPTLLTVSGKGKRVDLEHLRGSVIVDGPNVHFGDLDFQLQSNGEPQGIVQINGDVRGSKEDFHFDIVATWKAAAIDSPLTRAIWGMVSGESGIEYFDELEPTGHASAVLVTSGNSDQITYDVDITPSILSTSFNNRRASAVFDQGEGRNTIHFDNTGVQFQHLQGLLGDGTFSLDGEIGMDGLIDGEFDLTWNGPSGDSSLFAVLPTAVGDTLEAIELKDGTSDLPDGKVYFSGENWDDIGVSFTGNISLSDVSITIGIPMKNIMGTTYVDGEYDKDQLAQLEFVLNVDAMSTLGRNVTDIGGHLRLDSESQRIVFEEMRGESTTGSVTVDGWLSVDETKAYEIELLVAGVELKTGTGEDALASLEGELTGWLSMAGVRGESSSRRGLGLIRVQNGQFAADPLSLTAMQVLQLALPSTSSISGANIELYIDGDRMILDEITLTSDVRVSDMVLEGDGTIDTETFSLNARLHPRAGLPIIREIAGAINDHFYSVDITGELFNPTVTIVALPFLSPQEE